VLRQDPDVVLVGEMRDLETIEAALTIAETGHLVFATLHTNSAVSEHQPHHRRVPAAPAGAGARAQLSFVLLVARAGRGLSQQLLPAQVGQGPGRALAIEDHGCRPARATARTPPSET
jgi:twitching motility protein PilT